MSSTETKLLTPDRLLLTADLLGTFLFALEGAMAAVNGHLDLLGLLVLAFFTAVGGGIVRDVLLGAVPPAALRDWRYPTIAAMSGFAVFFFTHAVKEIPPTMMLTLDAAGLSLFAVAGTEKAIDFDLPLLTCIGMGGLTAVGGGTLRDLMLTRIPVILQRDIYASAALVGAAIMVMLIRMRIPRGWAMAAGAVACFAIRMISVRQRLNLPHF